MGMGPTGSDEGGPGVQTVLSEINVTPFVDVMLVLLMNLLMLLQQKILPLLQQKKILLMLQQK